MTKILPIKKYPDPVLRERTRDLDKEEINKPQTQSLIDDMILTMQKRDGIGIAAIQAGILKSIVVISDKNNLLIFINPKITKKSFFKIKMNEGCFSVPGVYKDVIRPKNVRISAFDRQGKALDIKLSGVLARVAQHEIDHLNGILFIDKAVK